MSYNTAGVTASLVPCTSITITAARATTVSVTGITYSSGENSSYETYGGQRISHIRLNAGQSVTVPTTVC
jgi:hypothetical protein